MNKNEAEYYREKFGVLSYEEFKKLYAFTYCNVCRIYFKSADGQEFHRKKLGHELIFACPIIVDKKAQLSYRLRRAKMWRDVFGFPWH